MNEMSGYIKLHRSFRNWEWYTNKVVAHVYLHLLLCANYQPDTWHGVEVGCGQLITGRKSIAEKLGFSEQQVRTALANLQKSGYITIKPTNKYSLVTIVGWENYQSDNVSSTYKPTNKSTVKMIGEKPQLKKNKNIIKQEGYNRAYTTQRQTGNTYDNSNNYDYEELRRLSREKIKRMIKESEDNAKRCV